jgi:hypothetical protein
MSTKITYDNLVPTTFTGIFKPRISRVVVTDNTYNFNIGNTVSTSGGFIKIVGSFFTNNSQLVIRTPNTKVSALASNITFISANELRVQMPSSTAGQKLLFVVSSDGTTAGTTVTYA